MVKLSVITTILEADERLSRSLQSLKARQNQEHIISVAGDYETAVETLQRSGNQHWTLCHAPGASIAEGFNECLKHCRGEFVWVLNSGDMEIDVEPLLMALEKNRNLDFAYGDIKYGERLLKASKGPLTKWSCILHGMCFCHGAVVVRKEVHQKYGLYNPQYKISMDHDFFTRAICSGAKGQYVDACIAQIEPRGVSGNIMKRTIENYKIISRWTPLPIALLLAMKWIINSYIARIILGWK